MPIKARTAYIDRAKGILILVVIFHHIMFAAKEMNVAGNWSWNLNLLPLYASWFMPAFFFITGYCSNFKKNFKSFIVGNIRTLLWPAIMSFLITTIYGVILFPHITSFKDAIGNIPIRGFNWFLMALFLSKILYWLINHFTDSNLAKGGITVLISVDAIFFNDFDFLNGNWFHHRHALYLTLFLYLGQIAKEKKLLQPKFLICATILFIGTALTCMKLSGVTPGIAGLWINFKVYQIPLHIFLALTGTLMVLYMSMQITRCKFLEPIGRDSLIYYIFHIDVIRTVLPFICKCTSTPTSFISVLATDAIILCVVVIICSGIAFIFNNSPLMKLIKL